MISKIELQCNGRACAATLLKKLSINLAMNLQSTVPLRAASPLPRIMTDRNHFNSPGIPPRMTARSPRLAMEKPPSQREGRFD